MRLKTMDGPLSVHNGNNDILNTPKRINTIQNSNRTASFGTTTTNYSETSNYTNSTTADYDNSINLNDHAITDLTDLRTTDLNILNRVVQDKVQWCKPSSEVQQRDLTLFNNANNRHNQLLNINNNTLAATIRQVRHGTASSIYSESSPDDSLLDFEEVQPSCSSADTSPQDEDRIFDVSDSESSEDGNLSHGVTIQRRGIVNPNYPGFQHLAHTLDFKTASDTDFTDDDFDCDSLTAKLQAEANNNNNVEDTDYKIGSVNRLDSDENIQKVFYDKSVFNVEDDSSEFNQTSSSSADSNNHSDEDTEVHLDPKVKVEEKVVNHEDIVGNFSKEVQEELNKVAVNEDTTPELPKLAKAIVKELEEAVEKLQVMKDLQPPRYNIEPNVEERFTKLSPSKQRPLHKVLNDAEIIKNTEAMGPLCREEPDFSKMEDQIKIKIKDAFLSDAKENLMPSYSKENLLKMEVDDNFKKSDLVRKDSNRKLEENQFQIKKMKSESSKIVEEIEKFCKEDITKDIKEKEEESVVPRKKEKVDIAPIRKRRDYNQQFGSWITVPRREMGCRNRDPINRKSVPMVKDKKKPNNELLGGFDVYNIETAMPKIDLDAIESHLRAAREEERRTCHGFQTYTLLMDDV